MGNRPIFTLNQRLAMCAGMVHPGAKLADIGTDHAYLPIWMAKSGLVSHAVAADLRENPLESARQNIIKYHVQNIVEARLSDGLRNICPGEADDIVIAGMGGEMIEQILAAAPWLRSSRKSLVLQPMTSAESLRRFLANEGYVLNTERAVRADGRVYSVMRAQFTGENVTQDVLYPYIGLLGESMQGVPADRSAACEYILREIRHVENRLKGFVACGDEEQAEQLGTIIQRLKEKIEV